MRLIDGNCSFRNVHAEARREQYENRLSEKEFEVARREAAVKEQRSTIAEAKDVIDEEVARKLKDERALIAAEEAKKDDDSPLNEAGRATPIRD